MNWEKPTVHHGFCPLKMTSEKLELVLLQQFVQVSMIAEMWLATCI
jgi:hypothetical protein